jgi:hypothetical protein
MYLPGLRSDPIANESPIHPEVVPGKTSHINEKEEDRDDKKRKAQNLDYIARAEVYQRQDRRYDNDRHGLALLIPTPGLTVLNKIYLTMTAEAKCACVYSGLGCEEKRNT